MRLLEYSRVGSPSQPEILFVLEHSRFRLLRCVHRASPLLVFVALPRALTIPTRLHL